MKQWLNCLLTLALMAGANLPSLASAHSSNALKKLAQSAHRTSRPLNFHDGFLYTPVTINGQPGQAILDTGSQGIHTTTETVRQLALKPTKSTDQGRDMAGHRAFNQAVHLPDIKLGDFKLKPVEAGIFQRLPKQNKPTLILGRDTLKQLNAMVDLAHKRLYVSHTPLSRQQFETVETSLKREDYLATPIMHIGPHHTPILPVQINDQPPFNCLLDTGTGPTLLSKPDSDSSSKHSQAGSRGIQIKRLTLNPLNTSFQRRMAVKNVHAEAADMPVLTHYLYAQGIVGLTTLARSEAIILPRRGVVFFKSH